MRGKFIRAAGSCLEGQGEGRAQLGEESWAGFPQGVTEKWL